MPRLRQHPPRGLGGEDLSPAPLRFVALQNMDGGGFGRIERRLRALGHAVVVVQAWRGDPLPAPDGADAVLVGGSPLAAYDFEDHAFLRDEAAFLRAAADLGRPVLGICFGAQFLAHLLGGRAYRAHRAEIGAHPVFLTDDGRGDPLLAGFPPRCDVLQWHGDSFDLPPGATLLARGEGIRHQLFRLGRVVGLQFHPEVTEAEVSRWALEHPDEVRGAGKTREGLVAEYRAIEPQLEGLGARLVDNFVAAVGRART